MSPLAATIIFAIAIVLAVLLAAPLILWLRQRRRRRDPASAVPPPESLTLLQVAPGLINVFLLAVAFASEYVAPDSWLGQRVANPNGKFWLFLLIIIPVFLLERALMPGLMSWQARRRSKAKRAP